MVGEGEEGAQQEGGKRGSRPGVGRVARAGAALGPGHTAAGRHWLPLWRRLRPPPPHFCGTVAQPESPRVRLTHLHCQSIFMSRKVKNNPRNWVRAQPSQPPLWGPLAEAPRGGWDAPRAAGHGGTTAGATAGVPRHVLRVGHGVAGEGQPREGVRTREPHPCWGHSSLAAKSA